MINLLHSLSLFFFYLLFCFFFNDTATTEIYTLSLHDALPISFNHVAFATRDLEGTHAFYTEVMGFTLEKVVAAPTEDGGWAKHLFYNTGGGDDFLERSEEHTSELQSHSDLVCRLLLEKKPRQRLHEQQQHDQACDRVLHVVLDPARHHLAGELAAFHHGRGRPPHRAIAPAPVRPSPNP